MAEIAKCAALNRESLHKALSVSGDPEFGTVLRILDAMGIKLSAYPAGGRRKPARKKRRAA